MWESLEDSSVSVINYIRSLLIIGIRNKENITNVPRETA